ncbi:MAG: hypothetical protein ABIR15_19465 [Chitinophagaceae bacterium]
MKNTLTLLLILFLCASCTAQGVFSNQTNNTLEKVVKDYPSQFKNIKGELLSSRPGSSEYKSTITIPGSVSTTIIQSAAAHKQSVCWQSVIYSGKEFDQAKSRFEELFNQIKNTIIKAEGEKAVIVNGMYIDPTADKTFTTIQFDLLPASGLMQKVNIDLLLQNTGNQWKIVLSVYDNDRKEAEAMVVK